MPFPRLFALPPEPPPETPTSAPDAPALRCSARFVWLGLLDWWAQRRQASRAARTEPHQSALSLLAVAWVALCALLVLLVLAGASAALAPQTMAWAAPRLEPGALVETLALVLVLGAGALGLWGGVRLVRFVRMLCERGKAEHLRRIAQENRGS